MLFKWIFFDVGTTLVDEKKAAHRIYHFFGNDYYCDECWKDYGEDYFERLKERD